MLGVLAEFIKFLGLENGTNHTKQRTKEEENELKELIDYENDMPKYYEESEVIDLGNQKIKITKSIKIDPLGKGKAIKTSQIKEEKIIKF
ncbi:hypothetical protein JG677_04520 [Campylobacter sp. TTU-622]|uniref:hypothetical protein n=1 Tax=Campylobacter sp. TTU-622 TaxID=2800583 RepID=UPI00182DA35F|nr:hypothetical protein [Campylobacter sp. TTU-622]EAI8568539.1 hypothetical protein [Campylobacter jejuni]EFS0701713.1 hypothetical protein [Campylobacter jejuni]EHS1057273.1 hypothetical protein [Campylobacter jejuni]EHS1059158.1 hypothetical protein [Campylobacter jejuni]EHS1060909.1 hypothetical protein [Campylobacter jejuni]